MIITSNSLSRGSGMPNQVDDAFVRAPCPVPSCPACEPNSGSVFPSVSTKAHSSRGGRHCYAIILNTETDMSGLSGLIMNLTKRTRLRFDRRVERFARLHTLLNLFPWYI